MKLSKTIPSRIKTVEFNWAVKDFLKATESYLSIRNGLNGRERATMTRCDWCHKKFEKDEWFALAQPKLNQEGPKRNWALCHNCADLMGAPSRGKTQI